MPPSCYDVPPFAEGWCQGSLSCAICGEPVEPEMSPRTYWGAIYNGSDPGGHINGWIPARDLAASAERFPIHPTCHSKHVLTGA